MTNFIIRPAVVEDMIAVHHLIRELAIYEKAEHEAVLTAQQLAQDGFGVSPLFRCLVAESNQQVIGFALFYNKYSTWKGHCIYLEDLLVTEKHRRDGVGSKLFEEVMKIAKSEKAKRFEWQVLEWNEPAINFYKKYEATLDAEWINCRLFF